MDSQELPPSVCEDDCGAELHSDDDNDSLPPSEEEPTISCCKRGNCRTKFEKDALVQYKMDLDRFSQGYRLQNVEAVRNVARQSEEQGTTCFQWTFLGQAV